MCGHVGGLQEAPNLAFWEPFMASVGQSKSQQFRRIIFLMKQRAALELARLDHDVCFF